MERFPNCIVINFKATTVYTRVQVEFFGHENGLKKSTSTYIRENMRHTYRITKNAKIHCNKPSYGVK